MTLYRRKTTDEEVLKVKEILASYYFKSMTEDTIRAVLEAVRSSEAMMAMPDDENPEYCVVVPSGICSWKGFLEEYEPVPEQTTERKE